MLVCIKSAGEMVRSQWFQANVIEPTQVGRLVFFVPLIFRSIDSVYEFNYWCEFSTRRARRVTINWAWKPAPKSISLRFTNFHTWRTQMMRVNQLKPINYAIMRVYSNDVLF